AVHVTPVGLCPPSFLFSLPSPTLFHTLSLHDALPICRSPRARSRRGRSGSGSRRGGPAPARRACATRAGRRGDGGRPARVAHARSEEHTSELQSPYDLVCRLLLEKKKKVK